MTTMIIAGCALGLAAAALIVSIRACIRARRMQASLWLENEHRLEQAERVNQAIGRVQDNVAEIRKHLTAPKMLVLAALAVGALVGALATSSTQRAEAVYPTTSIHPENCGKSCTKQIQGEVTPTGRGPVLLTLDGKPVGCVVALTSWWEGDRTPKWGALVMRSSDRRLDTISIDPVRRFGVAAETPAWCR